MQHITNKILFVSVISLVFLSFQIFAGPVVHPNKVKASKAEPLDRIVAEVNEGVITENQLSERVDQVTKEMQATNTPLPPPDVFRHQVLQQMINQKIQLQFAEKAGIRVNDEDINQAEKRIAKQNNQTVDQFYTTMQMQGWTKPAFREELSKEVMIQKLQNQEIASRVSISKQEVDDFLQTDSAHPGVVPEYHLSDILIAVSATPSPTELQKAREFGESLIKKIRAGADFSKVAQSQSGDSLALKGGDLGWRKMPELPTTFASQVQSMKVGDVEGPIQAPNGFHLIKLLEKHEGEVKRTEPEYEVRLILLRRGKGSREDHAVEVTLRGIRQKIESGTSFSQLAKRYSQDAQSAREGGSLGWIKKGGLGKTLEPVIEQLKAGDMTGPIATEQGWYLIHLNAKKAQVQSSVSERKEVEQQVFQRKTNEGVEAFINQLRGESYIKVLQ